jgi:peptidoglycan hydrolase-like protein with peptidoglycan-binding domain
LSDLNNFIITMNKISITLGVGFVAFALSASTAFAYGEAAGGNGIVGGAGGGLGPYAGGAPLTGNFSSPGQVLGAEVFQFTLNLRFGMRNNDVTELQKVLVAAGFLKIDAPTGYFGPLTLAAVKAYQTAHGISSTGFVGPLTRAALNAG